jgi:hypothetical protein
VLDSLALPVLQRLSTALAAAVRFSSWNYECHGQPDATVTTGVTVPVSFKFKLLLTRLRLGLKQ